MNNQIKFTLKNNYAFLSNFYYSPFVDSSGVEWSTVEHYYQAQKTVNMQERANIWKARTPKQARKLGRQVDMRPDWDQNQLPDFTFNNEIEVVPYKEEVMIRALSRKFDQNPQFARWLVQTGDAELIEWAPWDKYWGDGGDGTGLNRLGKLLMVLRDELKNYVDPKDELLDYGE